MLVIIFSCVQKVVRYPFQKCVCLAELLRCSYRMILSVQGKISFGDKFNAQISTFREIPDHQEVFVSAVNDDSIIVEIVELHSESERPLE